MTRSVVCGIGITDLRAKHGCPYYNRWKGVIRRCYGTPRRLPNTYEGCSVAEEWLVFSRFKSWMETQPWEGYHLDKDILRPWEMKYSPDTSVFVPPWINNLMNDSAAISGSLPIGVSVNRGRYMARVHNGRGKREFAGLFDTPEEAYQAWAKAKAGVIRAAVDRYKETARHDERVCLALLDKAADLAST